jgi:methyl-accepting chemotaxis protein
MSTTRFGIGARLWLGATTLLGALILLGVGVTWSLSGTHAEGAERLALANRKIQLSSQWFLLTQAATHRSVYGAMTSDPTLAAYIKEDNDAAIVRISQAQQALKALPTSPAEVALQERIAEARKHVLALNGKITQMRAAKATPAELAEVARQLQEGSKPYQAALADFAKLQEENVKVVQAEVDAQWRRSLVTAGVIAALLLAAALAATHWLVRSIRRPLDEAVGIAGRIAAGDLSPVPPSNRRDEFGQLMQALRAMAESLQQTVGSVREAADQIATGSTQIATGNVDLSQRTEEQASNLQQTAASMKQLTTTVRTNADSARRASELAGNASDVARQGGAAVGEVVHTMEAISAASRKISDIIGVIDGIAFQTNILALNAAVEAARAGEQGRGFAVVAGEVRTLAQRSADAAKEIKVLIGDSVSKVQDGSRQVGQAGKTMEDIVRQVQEVADLVGRISAATNEQTEGIAHVDGAVQQLDQVTQQNAALVEESAAAAESLKQQAARLVEAVGVFRLGQDHMRQAIAHAQATSRVVASTPARAAAKPAAPKAPAVGAAAEDDWQSF